MKALSGVDGAFLHLETPETPMHVASLHVYDLPPGYAGDFHADIRRQIQRRLHLAPVLTRKLAPMPLQFANPVWIQDEAIEMDYHVQRVHLPSPGTLAQLEDMAGRLHSELLDRNRPLWRVAVIEGLHTGQAAYYFQVHHAVLDGKAGVMLAQVLFDVSPEPLPVPRKRGLRAEHPGRAELAAAALKHDAGQAIKLIRHLPDVLRTLAGLLGPAPARTRTAAGKGFALGPKTPLNVPVTGERGFAAATVPMATLKDLAAAHDAKINDIVLALCGGALRRYLARHGGIPRKPLVATMPISLRDPGNAEYTTQATLSLVNLNTHIADPVKRLRAIRDSAGNVKAMAQRNRGVIPTDFPSIGMPWLLHGLATLYGRSGLAGLVAPIANVVISNVPGPQLPLYAAGARMRAYWPLSIAEHGVGLNITVMSYAGDMGFGFTTARCAVPDARALSVALLEALAELQACRLPARRSPRPTPGKTPRKTDAKTPSSASTDPQAGPN